MVKIDKGVPVPHGRNRGRSAKYPWSELEIGDSFVASTTEQGARGMASGWNLRHKAGYKFAFAKEDGGTRIWRVA